MINELMQIELTSWLKGGLIVLAWIVIAGFIGSRLGRFLGDEE